MSLTRTKLIVCVIVVALLGAVGAFASGEKEGEGPQNITWWYEDTIPEHQTNLRNILVEEFNEEQNAYELNLEFRGDLSQQLRVALASRKGPDIVLSQGPSYAAEMARNGQLLSLESYAEEFGWNENFADVMLEMGTVDGELYTIPKTYETIVLFYNETLMEENGWDVPTNLSELENVASQMMDQGIIPFGSGNSNWRGTNEWFVTIVLNHYAGAENVYKALTGEKSWTDPVFVEAIQLLKDWWDRGWFGDDYFSLTNEQAFALMADRSAGMSIVGTWAFQWIDSYFGDSPDSVNWQSFPKLSDNADYPLFTLGVGTSLGINKATDVPDGAAQVLNYLTTDEFLRQINSAWPGEWNLPVTSFSTEEAIEATDQLYGRHIGQLADTVAEGQYGYTTWSFWPPKTNQFLIEGIEQVWLGEMTPEEYLEELDSIFQEELDAGALPKIPER